MTHQLTEAEVRHVAKLSRLKLTDDQVRHFTTQLGHVLEYIDKLSELDVENVQPMAHPTSMTNKLRADVVTPVLAIDKVLHNAPASDPPFFKVPKVLGDGPSA